MKKKRFRLADEMRRVIYFLLANGCYALAIQLFLAGNNIAAGGFSGIAIVLSSVLMLVMTYLGDRIDWALIAARELELSFFDGFRIIPMLLAEGGIDPSNYWGNLAMLYLFLLVGAVPTILAAMKNQKKAQQIYSLDQ